MAFKMKGSPMHAGTDAHRSALKQWWNPFNREVKEERVDAKSYQGFGDDDDPYSTETNQRVYKNIFTGDKKVVRTDTKKSGGPGDFGGSRVDTKKTTTKLKQYGKKDDDGYDTREWKADDGSQTVKTKTKIKGAATGDHKWKAKTKTTDVDKMEDVYHPDTFKKK